jgi:hypothetical protein
VQAAGHLRRVVKRLVPLLVLPWVLGRVQTVSVMSAHARSHSAPRDVHPSRAAGRHSPFLGHGRGVDTAAKHLPVPGGRAERKHGGANGEGVVLQRSGCSARCRGRALYHPIRQPCYQLTVQRPPAAWRTEISSIARGSGRPGEACGSRTEAVLEVALRVAAPAERAERSADRANMLSGSWLGAGREWINGVVDGGDRGAVGTHRSCTNAKLGVTKSAEALSP